MAKDLESEKKKIMNERVQSMMQVQVEAQSREQKLTAEKAKISEELK